MDQEHQRIKDEIIGIIRKNVKAEHYKVFFFGSRANGKATAKSDIDIGIEAEEAVPPRVLSEIRDELENLRTLNKFDLVDFKKADKNFREVAMQSIEVIYEN